MSTYSDLKGGIETTVYSTAADLPLTGVSGGAQAYVTETNRLYLWNGSGWYNIALINTAPTITTGAAATYALAINGTATVITLAATDPEGVPITWSHSVTTGSLGSTATVSQSANVFTVTPSSTEAHAGTFSLTFTASDGINVATSTSAFTLAFGSPVLSGTLDTTIYNPTASNDGFADNTILMNDDYYFISVTSNSVNGKMLVFNRSNDALAYTITNTSGANYFAAGGAGHAVSGNYLVLTDNSATRKLFVYDISTFGSSTITSPNYTLNDPNYNNLKGDQLGKTRQNLSISGNYIVAGDHFYGSSYASNTYHEGIAYVWDISTFGSSTITSANYTLVDPGFNVGMKNDGFGTVVDINGTNIAVGTPGQQGDTEGLQSSTKPNDGKVYVYDISNFGSSVISSPDHTIANPDYGGSADGNDGFAHNLAVTENHIIVSAYSNDTPYSSAGTCYVFNVSNGTLLYTIASPIASGVANQWMGYKLRADGNNFYAQTYQGGIWTIYHYDIGSFTASTPAVIATSTGIENTLTLVNSGDAWGNAGNFYAYDGKLMVGAASENATNGSGGSVTSSGVVYVYE